MRRLARAIWVIARRDYVATVFSRTFLIFLIGPLLPLIFVGVFGAVSGDRPDGAEPPLTVAMAPADVHVLIGTRERIARRLGPEWLPPLGVAARASPDEALLSGSIARPLLTGTRQAVAALRGPVTLLIEQARVAPPPGDVAVRVIATPPAGHDRARRQLAKGSQIVLFLLTMILAGMLISNLVEEKASKVIEVLAAAVPVDAIFAGKLVAMLAVSFTGIAIWGGAAAIGAAALLPHWTATLATPAVGWPAFALLGMLDFTMVYLLIGAIYLGIGAQAGSAREVQTLSLPLTMAQLAAFGLASAAAKAPDAPLGLVAAIIPWSSPFAMIARAAVRPAWWPHLLALGWQLLCLALIVRLMARVFRRIVLKSGGSQSRGFGLFRRSRRAT